MARAPRPVQITVEPITEDTAEPPKGSVVMMFGLTGTAFQRLYDYDEQDAKAGENEWYATTGVTKSWDDIRTNKRGHHFIIIHADD